MLCEKCGQEVEHVTCSNCSALVVKLGDYCYACGTRLINETPEEEGPDFSDRVLCSDGACIGVINEEGLCKECGKPYAPDSSGS
jgi:hypothetical protein